MKKLSGQHEPEPHLRLGAIGRRHRRRAGGDRPPTLRTRHEIAPGDPDDFTVQTQDDIVALRTQTTQTMTTLLAGVAFVSLVVGGIGIMNIMLVSVTERTREIGLRLAIGARGSDVLFQFLIEAVVISLVGGAIGIALGLRRRLGACRYYQQLADARAAGRGLHGRGVLGGRRDLLRVLPGAQSGRAGSDRSAAVRVACRGLRGY